MKYIKRVATTFLNKIQGAIIDSLNTSVDETTNAPSIRAVKEGLADKNAILATIATTGLTHALQSTDAEKLTLKSTETKIGSKLNITNGAIVIGENIKYIKISAQVYFYDVVAEGKKGLQIKINNNIVSTVSHSLKDTYTGINIAERIYKVNTGDKVELYVKGAINDTVFSGETATYVSVEAIA